MKKYLSMGFGVNSVAMYLMLSEQGDPFEPVFVNHRTDWPDTYRYAAMFQWWAKRNGLPPIKILFPEYGGHRSLYEYCIEHKMMPKMYPRWCTNRFKIQPLLSYYEKPCFQYIGIDAGEQKRAKISINNGVENRYPLIEAGIDRNECKEIIVRHGLPVPIRSGCYICPFQKKSQWIDLRINHPDLFCRAVTVEKLDVERQRLKGKKPMMLSRQSVGLETIVDNDQMRLFHEDEYPPCQCEL